MAKDGVPPPRALDRGPGGIETELKFAMARRHLAALSASPLLRLVLPDRRRLRSVYFDTPDDALRKAGCTLRLREGEAADKFVQTLKRDHPAEAGLFSRGESAWTLDRDAIEIEYLAGLVPDTLLKAARNRLEPRFTVSVERTIWELVHAGTTVSLTYDDGIVEAGGRREPIAEFEIELVAGPPDGLFEIAREIARSVPLRLDLEPKAEKGYRLAAGKAPEARKAEEIALARGTTSGEAFRIVASNCIRQFVVNEAALLATGAPDPLHQMRVAIRRFRSLAAFSRRLFTEAQRQAIRNESRRLFRSLGAVRDLDVLIDTLLAGGEAEKADALRPERERALVRAVSRLRSRRFSQRLIDLVALVECGDRERADDPDRARAAARPVERLAARILTRHFKALRRAPKLSRLDEEERHRVRIRAKKLRYACDFYAGLFPAHPRRRAKFLKRIAALQDGLGVLNDRRSIRGLVERHFDTAPDRVLPGPIGGAGEQAMLECTVSAQRALRRARPFWS